MSCCACIAVLSILHVKALTVVATLTLHHIAYTIPTAICRKEETLAVRDNWMRILRETDSWIHAQQLSFYPSKRMMCLKWCVSIYSIRAKYQKRRWLIISRSTNIKYDGVFTFFLWMQRAPEKIFKRVTVNTCENDSHSHDHIASLSLSASFWFLSLSSWGSGVSISLIWRRQHIGSPVFNAVLVFVNRDRSLETSITTAAAAAAASPHSILNLTASRCQPVYHIRGGKQTQACMLVE